MTSDQTAYWTAVAQVLPVFGLAVVLEARTLAQSWKRHGMARERYRRVQIWLLCMAAFGVGVGTTVALGALRAGEAPGPISHWIVTLSLSAALTGTLITPMSYVLMHSESTLFARAVAWSPSASRLIWQLKRGQRANLRNIVRLRQDAYVEVVKYEDLKEQAEATHEQATALPMDDEFLARSQTALHRVTTNVERARLKFRQMISYEQNLKLHNREVRKTIRKILREEREGWSTLASRLIDPVAGVTQPFNTALIRAAPDDGGFLPPHPTLDGIPRYRLDDRTHFITDPSEFYRSGG